VVIHRSMRMATAQRPLSGTVDSMIENFIDDRGVLLRRDVLAALFDDRPIRRAVRSQQLTRIRSGAYCLTAVWQAADRAERHRLTSHAVRRRYGDDVARSHASAHLELGGPDWGIDLRNVHLTNLTGIGERTQSGIVHHRGVTRVGDVTRHDGSWLTAPVRTALDTATLAPRDPAVCVLNYYQQRGLASRAELEHGIEQMKEWPASLGLRLKLRLSSESCESVGEQRTELMCRDQRIPMPIPQYEISHPSGRLAGRVDFAWPWLGKMMEFDGDAKYLSLRRPGETIEQCVMREKAREDLLRRLTGWQLIRVIWADLDRPGVTAAMIRDFLGYRAA
jgi:hypothetical protein